MIQIDFITTLIAAIVSMIIALVWYSPFLFGNIWMELAKVEKGKMPKSKIFFGFINTYIQALFLHIIVSYMAATSFWDGVIVGIVVWFGFIVTTQFSAVLWSKRPLKLYFLDVGCWLLCYIAMGGILAG